MKTISTLIALTGQPNCGKSTVFNAITGASQHVANYPGVTVEKMSGFCRHEDLKIEVVDLPGTYSLTSYSLEERVTRGFLLEENPPVVVNVVDASNLERNLYLTLQLLEMEMPLVMDLNMMDVAERRHIRIDTDALSKDLGVPVVGTAIKNGKGKKELLTAISGMVHSRGAAPEMRVDYGSLEPLLGEVEARLSEEVEHLDYSKRWMAIKLLEGDAEALKYIHNKMEKSDPFLAFLDGKRSLFERNHEELPARHMAYCRYALAARISKKCVTPRDVYRRPLSDRIDGWVCHRLLGPLILVGVLYMLYYLSIVQGYNLTNYTWPLLAWIRNTTAGLMPDPGFIEIPLIRSFALWFVDSINALLNYIPIFFILFGLIAILEDSGYMPRMAFILDRLFSRYGLHGSSTLPMVLGGIYVGGCAVPAVMSTKGIPDERSRLATILIIPLLNCLAKVPLYVLLINIYFVGHKGMAMFFISTISLLMVLPIARVLTLTVLKKQPTAPFIMEMPPYHLPTFRGVLGRAVERVWLFVRKIITIVAAVAVVIFLLLQFPGLSAEREHHYALEKERVVNTFYQKIEGTGYETAVQGANLMPLLLYAEQYKKERMGAKGREAVEALEKEFKEKNPVFSKIVQPGKDKAAKKVNRALKKLDKARKGMLREIKSEKIDNSFLGRLGRLLEPATRYAGFNWKVNVALLSAFAAKESSVATLGALYDRGESEAETLEQRMSAGETGFTSLHALALMLFMVLYPPCIATSIMVKIQSGSVKWMLFSMIYPMILGLSVATLVFTGGKALGLDGNQAMAAFFGLVLTAAIVTGFLKGNSSTIGKSEEG